MKRSAIAAGSKGSAAGPPVAPGTTIAPAAAAAPAAFTGGGPPRAGRAGISGCGPQGRLRLMVTRISSRSRLLKFTGRASMESRRPVGSRTKRDGNARSTSGVANDKVVMGSRVRLRVYSALRSRSMPSNGRAPSENLRIRRLSGVSAGLPPSMRMISAVSPRVKSKVRTAGVGITAAPSCCIDGALSSSLSDTSARQLRPSEPLREMLVVESVPTSATSSSAWPTLAVRRLLPKAVSPRSKGMSRLRRRSRWLRDRSVVTSPVIRRAKLSMPRVPTPPFTVTPRSPAGRVSGLPVANSSTSRLSLRLRPARSPPATRVAVSVRSAFKDADQRQPAPAPCRMPPRCESRLSTSRRTTCGPSGAGRRPSSDRRRVSSSVRLAVADKPSRSGFAYTRFADSASEAGNSVRDAASGRGAPSAPTTSRSLSSSRSSCLALRSICHRVSRWMRSRPAPMFAPSRPPSVDPRAERSPV